MRTSRTSSRFPVTPRQATQVRCGICLTTLVLFVIIQIVACLLVLLILADQVVHVTLGLSELHFVHSLARVPVEESLTPEHGSELLRNPLEDLLNGRRIPNESGSHH